MLVLVTRSIYYLHFCEVNKVQCQRWHHWGSYRRKCPQWCFVYCGGEACWEDEFDQCDSV